MSSGKTILSIQHLKQIESCLTFLRRETKALRVLLADVSGHLIEEQGVDGRIDASVLSALAAGEMAASRELARLVGQEARFKLLLHEGDGRSVYLSEVDEETLLITVCDNNTPIGLLRFYIRETVNRLRPILHEARQQQGGVEITETDLAASLDQLLIAGPNLNF